MNINGQGHLLTCVEGHSDSTFSNFFRSESARPIEAKFHVEPPWDRGTKVCSNGLCHMTNMAAMPTYGKPAHEIMVFFVVRKHILQTRRILSHTVGDRCLIFRRTLRLLPYFMCANSKGSGETARMRRLC